MKRPFRVTAGIIGAIIISYAFTGSKDPGYKNLKILPKNITEQQMDSVMHHFTASLNVKCNFCHVRNEETKEWDHASDANKHKLVAREMMTMTNNLNDKYFPYSGKAENLSSILTVTCFTCHNGQKEPATKAPRPQKQQLFPPFMDTTKRN
ncbi:MAG TPA: c-type cytochrome [Flavisolibacter sp.]|jgi:hypothetical protein|nr:c-type cytochrome [Flavisolibacter sp.]